LPQPRYAQRHPKQHLLGAAPPHRNGSGAVYDRPSLFPPESDPKRCSRSFNQDARRVWPRTTSQIASMRASTSWRMEAFWSLELCRTRGPGPGCQYGCRDRLAPQTSNPPGKDCRARRLVLRLWTALISQSPAKVLGLVLDAPTRPSCCLRPTFPELFPPLRLTRGWGRVCFPSETSDGHLLTPGAVDVGVHGVYRWVAEVQ